jgi:hypothetical protein
MAASQGCPYAVIAETPNPVRGLDPASLRARAEAMLPTIGVGTRVRFRRAAARRSRRSGNGRVQFQKDLARISGKATPPQLVIESEHQIVGTVEMRITAHEAGAKPLQPVAEVKKNVFPINLDEEIRKRAYELYAQRGYATGFENEDWLTAEREVLSRYQPQSA